MTGLRLDSTTAELRRRLGSVPWFIFEELLLAEGETSGGLFIARASSRSLARAVSLNKDTVARALAVLRGAGLVAHQRQAKDGGRFGTGTYRLKPPPGIQRIDEAPARRPPKPARVQPTRPRPALEPTQLPLLDDFSTSSADGSHRSNPPSPKQGDALAPGVRPGAAGRDRDASGTSGTAAGPC